VLGPPPAPTFDTTHGDLEVVASGLDDTGGLMRVEASYDLGELWEAYDQRAWAAVANFGPLAGIPSGWYRCREEGNGTTYVGASEWSEVIVLE